MSLSNELKEQACTIIKMGTIDSIHTCAFMQPRIGHPCSPLPVYGIHYMALLQPILFYLRTDPLLWT